MNGVREDFPAGEMVDGNPDVEPGITAHWGITPNLILTGAINPDFSQVEADAAQLDVNTQFALFYPEKRPFFLEGANIFATRFNAIYSRNIADPNWGIKLNPQTVFFLGYSDSYMGEEQVELTQQNRTLFLKIGYAWLL
jgi:hypothetical protein